MPDFTIERYSPSRQREWDAFVEEARNATFLFRRGYMDYHSDRFADCSWIAFKGNRLMALLPGNIDEEGTLHSHQGLTYGGWLLPQAHLDGAGLLEIFACAVEKWQSDGIKELDYKPLPAIYATRPSDEDIYALFRLGAKLSECNLSSAAALAEGVRFNTLQRRHLGKAERMNVKIREVEDEKGIVTFMEMLASCLAERHGVAPVHTAAEMILLKSRFPKQIRFFTAGLDGAADAGVCVYDCGHTAHAQYIATTPRGREQNLLAPLFYRLMTETFAGAAYFDFGISNEAHGQFLNEGLLRQKFSYGATGAAYMRYSLKL